MMHGPILLNYQHRIHDVHNARNCPELSAHHDKHDISNLYSTNGMAMCLTPCTMVPSGQMMWVSVNHGAICIFLGIYKKTAKSPLFGLHSRQCKSSKTAFQGLGPVPLDAPCSQLYNAASPVIRAALVVEKLNFI